LGNRTLAAIFSFVGLVFVLLGINVNELADYLSGAQRVIEAVSIPAVACIAVALACFGAAGYVLYSDSY